jgi:hypothetical protein
MRKKEIPMKSIRNYAYASLLALTALNVVPSPASAQEAAHGKFTLTHDVRWQNAVVPAGDYQFSYNEEAAPRLLMLNKLNGSRTGFMLLVRDSEDAKPTDLSRLILQTTADGTYVSAMQLPEFGVTLHFRVPSATAERRIAKAVPTTMASAR